MIKLILSRHTFAQDMTGEERDIMKQHAAYWEDKADKGIALVYGPVLYHKGVYGLESLKLRMKMRPVASPQITRRLNPGFIG